MAGENSAKTPLGGVKAFNCRNCGGQIELLAPGQTLSAACKHCGAIADLTDENFNLLSRISQRRAYNPVFEIGSTAEFEGKKWKLIGFMVRKVVDYEYYWNEYLLFNPQYGFRFLVDNYGHWSWVKMVTNVDSRKINRQSIWYERRRYSAYTEGKASIAYALGEFFWQVKKDDIANTKDLISPPYMISAEVEDEGIVWSKGGYLEPEAVAAAFGKPDQVMPEKVSVGANQPNHFRKRFWQMVPIWLIAVVAIVGLNTFFNSRAKESPIMQWELPYPLENDSVSRPFELEGPVENVRIILSPSRFENAWLEGYGTLHRLDTNVSYTFAMPMEYYYGVTTEGYWTEGSKVTGFVIEGIPSGRYELLLSSSASKSGTVKISMQRGIPSNENMTILLILISILPAYFFIRARIFEKKRQENAD